MRSGFSEEIRVWRGKGREGEEYGRGMPCSTACGLRPCCDSVQNKVNGYKVTIY